MKIKDQIIQDITAQIDKQTEKGIAKYDHDLDACKYESYDWQQMLNEELIDGLQYANKEIKRLNKENDRFSSALMAIAQRDNYVAHPHDLAGFVLGLEKDESEESN